MEEEEEEEPNVEDMVVDPEHDVSKERERSVSASAATRLPLSGRTGASRSLKRPHSSGGGSAKKRGRSVAFKEGHRRWDRLVANRELEEVDEATELWNYLRGKASKIDFSDLGDGELNLIAAALFREQQRRELEKHLSRQGPQEIPPEHASGATIGTRGRPGAGAPQRGILGGHLCRKCSR